MKAQWHRNSQGDVLMTAIRSYSFLRGALLLDAVATGATALLAVAAAGPLSGLLGLPPELLRGAGLALAPFVLLVAWSGSRQQAPALAVNAIIAINAAWVIASLGLLVSGFVSPTLLGYAFVIGQALIVAGFAELQFIGRRRARTQLAL